MARILVVDDEALMRTMAEVVCTRMGHEVLLAESVSRGLELGRQGVDVVLLDVWLPDGNGLELKCPFTSRDFMKFRLGGFEAIKSAYMAQVQYSMWVTRKDAWYFANYDPRMKREGLHYVVIERNEKYMASFDEMVPEFIEKMDEALAEIGFVFGEQWR